MTEAPTVSRGNSGGGAGAGARGKFFDRFVGFEIAVAGLCLNMADGVVEFYATVQYSLLWAHDPTLRCVRLDSIPCH